MRVYQLKNLTQRSVAFGLAVSMFSILSAYALPNGVVHADALNPLTERTLLLSSSSPGDHYLDAAGNVKYAAPGSGPNGQKTEETFTFKVSTNSEATGFNPKDNEIQALTFQYCKTAAGACVIPGDGTDTRLNAHYGTGSYNATVGLDTLGAGVAPVQGDDFEIWVGGTEITYDPAHPWLLTTSTVVTSGDNQPHNFITLSNEDSTIKPAAGTAMKIVFKASDDNYITNPKSGAFFVRINTYEDDAATTVIDGGVTVANVMTDSIEIRTKVLETMSFSVGTLNPDVETLSVGSHGPCDAIATNAPLYMGNSTAEYSLEVGLAYDTTSYWRLSSNSSNGASVYYSGYTLSNTSDDQIDAIGTSPAKSHPGQEQFGLAFTTQDTPLNQYNADPGLDHGVANANVLTPLAPEAAYDGGAGTITLNGTAEFAFDAGSDQIPRLLAQNGDQVIGCTTGKMRYLANIAAVTPAGIYASKVNYLAAPQY